MARDWATSHRSAATAMDTHHRPVRKAVRFHPESLPREGASSSLEKSQLQDVMNMSCPWFETSDSEDEPELITPNHTTYFCAATSNTNSRKEKRSPRPSLSPPDHSRSHHENDRRISMETSKIEATNPNRIEDPSLKVPPMATLSLFQCLSSFHQDARRRSIYELNADAQDAGEWADLESAREPSDASKSSGSSALFLPVGATTAAVITSNGLDGKLHEMNTSIYLPMPPPHIKMQLSNMNPFR